MNPWRVARHAGSACKAQNQYVCGVKQLLAFSILFLHLFGTVSFAEAKENGQLRAEKAARGAAVSASGLHFTDAAELAHSLLVSFSAHKIREHRPAPAMLRYDGIGEVSAFPFQQVPLEHLSLPYLSHLRLLLFPRHYFW